MGLTNLNVTDIGHGIEVSNTYVYIKDIRIQNDAEYNVYCNVEPNQNSEELSGVTRWRLEEEVANLRTENARLTEDLRRKEIALQALT